MPKRSYTSATGDGIPETYTEMIDIYHEMKNSRDVIPLPEIHNLVSTCNIESSVRPIDLEQVTRLLPNSHYDKQKFAAITMRLQEPSCTVLLFTSGKMVLTGTTNFLDCLVSANHVLALLRQGVPGVRFTMTLPRVQNIVGNVNLNLSENLMVDLNRLHAQENIYCTYQKNMFPGLIYRPVDSPVVFLVFNSGKIVLTGAKSTLDLYYGWQTFWPRICEFITKQKE